MEESISLIIKNKKGVKLEKWTNQQKLLSLCGVVGSGLALELISKAIKIGPLGTHVRY